jgi:polyisoprenoid-binding protein YceI
MVRLHFILVLFFGIFGSVELVAQQKNWEATQTDIRFFIRNAGLEVEGTFGQVTGTFVTQGPDNLPLLIVGTAKVKSIDTGIGLRDSHLRSKEYFNAASFPELRMQLISINEKTARFNVSIRGKSKTYDIPYTWKLSQNQGLFAADFTLNRLDFLVGGKSMIMGDEVIVKIKLTLKK